MGRVLVLGLVGLGIWVWRLDQRVQTYLAGPALGGVRVYAAPSVLQPGGRVPGGSLVRMLGRLGYRAGDGEHLAVGEYRVAGKVVDLVQRPSPVPWGVEPRRVRVTLGSGRIAEIEDVQQGRLDRLEMEPELLAVLGTAGATLGAGRDVEPRLCRDAVLAAEDQHFFHHPGIDPLAVARALLVDMRAGAAREGGSTITQQLIKNSLLSPRRTLARKATEAVLSILLELHATKEEILHRYLSSVYLGVDEGVPIHGFAQAAEVYFTKPLGELGAAECALLAGVIRSPNGLSPRRRAQAATERRNRVLDAMVEDRFLGAPAARAAKNEPLRLAPPRSRPVAALYVADEVTRELARVLPADVATAPGLVVQTGIDAEAQREAERAVRRGLDALERGRRRTGRLQAALVALDPFTGRVRALVGGRDYRSSQLDRAWRTRRQPGSAFKPFVYVAALDPERRGGAPARTVVSPVEDTPLAVPAAGGLWRPANYDGTFRGAVVLEDALAQSINTVAVRLALEVGVDAVAQTAQDLGVSGALPRVPALALGVADVSLIELARAYAVFADGGTLRPTTLIVAVGSPAGETLYVETPEERRVLAPGVAYLMTHLLQRVVQTGTGQGAASVARAVAGKTGTTDDTRDAWFVGFTPEIVAGVWVGFDEGGSTGLTGALGALPIWSDFVRATTGGSGLEDFPVPDDIVWRDVDPATAELATSDCPERRHVPFLAGTEPTVPCERHRPQWTAVGGHVGQAVREGSRALGGGGRRVLDWLGGLFR